jgi:transmembrane sensor
MKENVVSVADLLLWRITGELREGEQQILEDWLNASPDNRRLLEALDDETYFNTHWRQFNEIDTASSWEALQARAIARGYTGNGGFTGQAKLFFRSTAAIYVMVIGVLITGLILFLTTGHKAPVVAIQPVPAAAVTSDLTLTYGNQPAIAFDAGIRDSTIIRGNLSFQLRGSILFIHSLSGAGNGLPYTGGEPFTIHSPTGSQYQVVLPDSSLVLMNAQAQIDVSAGYGRLNRRIQLKGEAHFEISRELPNLAFIVGVIPPEPLQSLFAANTGLDITARGTSFDVRANPENQSIRVVLSHGSIMIQRPDDSPRYVDSGMAYLLDKDGKVRILPSSMLYGVDSWKNGEFYFEFEPVENILGELSRWYGVTIKYPKTRFTDSFQVSGPRKKGIEFMLDQMKATDRFHYRESNDTIYVSH